MNKQKLPSFDKCWRRRFANCSKTNTHRQTLCIYHMATFLLFTARF